MSKPGIRFPHFIAAVTIFALLAVGQATAAEPIDAADAVRVPDAVSVTDASDLVASPAVASTSAAPASATTDSLVERIVDQVDRLYRSTTSHSRLEMLIVNPNWERRLEMEIWTRGMNETFIRILDPKKDAGIATLRRGTEMWNFFPKIDKVMKVPPSMMMGSWMGSDFSNDDLVKESTLIDDYDARPASAPDGSPPGFHYVELLPKAQTATVWGRILLAVRADDLLPVTETYFDEKGRAMRRIEFGEVRDFGGRLMPATMEMVPLHKEGHRTVIRYLEARFGLELPDDTFGLRNLRKRR